MERPQHQDGGYKGRCWSSPTLRGISPLPLEKPWAGAFRLGATEGPKWLMGHGWSQERVWDSG